MDDLYRDYILDHYRRPRNFGRLANPDISHEEENPLCGDRIRLELKLADGKVEAVRFDGHGCAISQASASMLTEMIQGQPLEEIGKIGREDVLDNLGLDSISPARMKCAMLALRVLRNGVFGAGEEEGDEAEATAEEEEELWPPR